MKIGSTLAAVSIAIGAVAITAEAEHVQRALIIGGEVLPEGSKQYMVSLRSTAGGETICGGVLVSPWFVLTTPYCLEDQEVNYVAVGTHYLSGTDHSGEYIKVVSAQTHMECNLTVGSHAFTMLTLENRSSFTPIKLPKADDTDIMSGMLTKTMGWGSMGPLRGNISQELRIVSMPLWDNTECVRRYNIVGNTSVCAGGVLGKGACTIDMGGPLIKEGDNGDLDDTLIGVLFWGLGCGMHSIPGIYSRVSAVLDWINSVIATKP